MNAKKNNLFRRLCKLLLVKVPLIFVAVTVLWVLVLKWVPVWVTPLMAVRTVQNWDDANFHTHKTWKSLEHISPEMIKAVVASEDNLFYEHHGFDWKQIQNAVGERKKGKRMRGASTISQQTAKNVFLFPSRNFIRKGFEAYFTVLIEAIWGKDRIMEVYLNVAEMGKGIYGAEAAAKYLFKKDASSLTRRECCLLAACLPSPVKRNAAAPSQYVLRRASAIESLEGKLAWPEFGR